MIIRELFPEEKYKCSALMGTAFNFSIDIEQQKNELLSEDSFGAFLDDNETLMAQVVAKDYSSFLYGNEFGTLGIAGVSTYPQYRRNGCIRQIMKHLFSLSENKKWIISYLYPFSFDYYRQFGYERAFQTKSIRFPLRSLSKIERYSEAVLYNSKDLLPDLSKAYSKFAKKNNGMLTRTDYREWCSDPYKSLNYTYLFYTDDKIPDGYINFKINSNNIVVNEMAYYSPKTLLNILGFLRMYDGQYTDVIIHNVDLYSDFESYIGEFRNVSYEIYDGPMVRILDVKEYLKKIIKPSFDFVLAIKINDIYIDKNNKTFKLEYNNNLLNITETQEKADIECDISTFSSIATGSRMINNNNYIFYNSIKIFDKSELFFNLFPAVPMNQFDRF